MARRDRPVRHPRRVQLRLHRRRSTDPQRLRRPGRPHHRGARGQSAVLLQQPDRRDAGRRTEPRRQRSLTPLVSIDGPRAVNDALRGAGSHDDVMSSIAVLLAAGLDPVANTVLVRPALPGLARLARQLYEAGVDRLHLILPHQRGMTPGRARSARAQTTGPSFPPLYRPARNCWPPCAGYPQSPGRSDSPSTTSPAGDAGSGMRNDLCAAGCRDLSVDPAGHVHACVITAGDPAFIAGSLRERPLDQIGATSRGLRLLRAARARDRAECLACPVADDLRRRVLVQAHDRSPGRAAKPPATPRRSHTASWCARCSRSSPPSSRSPPKAPVAAASSAAADCVAAGACGGQSSAGADDYSLFDCI